VNPNSTPLLIVGLGNPGAEYARTRHNIGFMAVDYLADKWGVSWQNDRKFQGWYGVLRQPCTGYLLKPNTYMNNSGQSVRAVLDWFKLAPDRVLVIYDDMDLPLGKLRLRQSGSAGGHNGMKSIIAHLGTTNFPRLRLGIGRSQGNVHNHVLGGFSSAESALIPEIMSLMAELIHCAISSGWDKAMSLYNSRSIASHDLIR
jgi:PTH1 family peptidyl-tRNA hydrolase